MTLAMRAKMFHRKFPEIHITEQCLGRVYKKYNIKRKQVIVKKFASPDKTEVINDMIELCKDELTNHIVADIPIYYIDECMFTVKTYLQTDWAPKRLNV